MSSSSPDQARDEDEGGVLSWIIDLCLAHRVVVLIAAALLAAVGAYALQRLPLDAFPDTTPVQVTVNTVAPTLSPLEVERQITLPVEQVLNGLPGIHEARSISKFGLSQVTLIFEDDVGIYLARQVVSERLASVQLPDGIERPTLGPVSTGLGEVFHYLVTGDGKKSLSELRTVHDWVIRPPLSAVPGVAEINAWGGEERQLQVVVDPDLLIKHDLRPDDVVQALRRNNTSVGGGVLTQAGEATLVQGLGLAATQDDLRDVVIAAHQGVPIRVRDVARVEDGHEVRRGAVTADGKGEAVLGLGFMLMGENSRVVTLRLAERLEEVKKTLPPGVHVEPVYSRTSLVDHVLETVRKNLLEGALLVIAVLFAFLGNLRAGLIVALAIPLSMLCAFDLMLRFGIAGSLMSLGAIDFGLVVDSSVIMVENAARRLGEDRSERSVREVVRDAAIEVRRPTLFGELIIMIVYLPILTLEGVEGKLFRPMALTVIFALIGSMVLSLTVMPVLASLALKRGSAGHDDNFVVRALKWLYRPVVAGALRWPVVVLVGAVLAVIGGGVLASRLGSEFVPRLREGAIVVNTVRLASVSLEESVRYGTRIELLLRERFPDEVERVWTRTGTAEVATDPMGLELSDVFVTLTPRERWTKASTQDELVVAMSEVVRRLPGMKAIFTQPIEMRVNEMIAGVRADLGIKLFGDDLEVLKAKAAEIQTVVQALPGAADVSAEQVTGLPVLQVTVDRPAISRYGITVDDVLDAVAMLGTKQVGEVKEGARRFDLVVRLDDRFRVDPDAVGSILIPTPDGQRIPLSRLARVEVIEGPSTIQHEWGKRRIVVQANVRGRDISSFVADVQRALEEKVPLPAGYRVDFGGQFEHLVAARQRLLVVVPLALALVLTLLYVTYGRVLDALRVFTGVPFAAVGGVLALWLRDLPFSISAAVGFIALCGVSVLGDMVLVSTIRQLLATGMPIDDAIRKAAETRLRPVLMTALVAALGFLPMALNTGIGAEVQRPLATVVIGGVASSTLLTLVVLPVLYSVMRPRSGPGSSTTTRID